MEINVIIILYISYNELEGLDMKKLNNYINFGLILNVIGIISHRFNLLPSFIQGLCIGLGLTLIFIGMYDQNHNLDKFRNYKKNILNKILGK